MGFGSNKQRGVRKNANEVHNYCTAEQCRGLDRVREYKDTRRVRRDRTNKEDTRTIVLDTRGGRRKCGEKHKVVCDACGIEQYVGGKGVRIQRVALAQKALCPPDAMYHENEIEPAAGMAWGCQGGQGCGAPHRSAVRYACLNGYRYGRYANTYQQQMQYEKRE